jgi:hypothetical protein
MERESSSYVAVHACMHALFVSTVQDFGFTVLNSILITFTS